MTEQENNVSAMEIDWTNDEAVVRAAAKANGLALQAETYDFLYMKRVLVEGKQWSAADTEEWAWRLARRHPIVVAFESASRHASQPAAASNGYKPLEMTQHAAELRNEAKYQQFYAPQPDPVQADDAVTLPPLDVTSEEELRAKNEVNCASSIWQFYCWYLCRERQLLAALQTVRELTEQRDAALAESDFWQREMMNYRQNATHRARQIADQLAGYDTVRAELAESSLAAANARNAELLEVQKELVAALKCVGPTIAREIMNGGGRFADADIVRISAALARASKGAAL